MRGRGVEVSKTLFYNFNMNFRKILKHINLMTTNKIEIKILKYLIFLLVFINKYAYNNSKQIWR